MEFVNKVDFLSFFRIWLRLCELLHWCIKHEIWFKIYQKMPKMLSKTFETHYIGAQCWFSCTVYTHVLFTDEQDCWVWSETPGRDISEQHVGVWSSQTSAKVSAFISKLLNTVDSCYNCIQYWCKLYFNSFMHVINNTNENRLK